VLHDAAELLAEGHARIAAELAALAAIDLRELDQEKLAGATVDAHTLQSQLEAHVTRVVGVFDTHGDPEGAAGTVPWVTHRCRIKRSQAKAEVMRARALRHMPAVAAAFAAGELTAAHVRLLAAAQRSNPEAFAKAEEELVDDASTLRFDVFARRVAYFRQLADPDGVEDAVQDAFARRAVHASRTFEDTIALDGTLDAIGGSIFKNELDRLERIEFEADWREARDRLGESATSSDLRRSFEQRRADALVEMARRSAAMPADARMGRILLTVLVGYETFGGRICQLADGTVVTPGSGRAAAHRRRRGTGRVRRSVPSGRRRPPPAAVHRRHSTCRRDQGPVLHR
jgi:hypothetical protein